MPFRSKIGPPLCPRRPGLDVSIWATSGFVENVIVRVNIPSFGKNTALDASTENAVPLCVTVTSVNGKPRRQSDVPGSTPFDGSLNVGYVEMPVKFSNLHRAKSA